jgi:5'-nucleotidase
MFISLRFHRLLAVAALSLGTSLAAFAVTLEEITILHVGDQESWLLSAQGNLRNDNSQPLSYYGGVDRLAALMDQRETANTTAGRAVFRVNAGDAWLPGPRFNASLVNLGTAHPDGGQDYYDTIAMREIAFDAAVFGNHEFDLGLSTAARFAEVSGTTYISMNLDFSQDPAFAALETSGTVAPYAIGTTPSGKKVAFIGITTPLLPAVSSPQTLALMNGFAGFSTSNTEDQNIAALVVPLQAIINDLRTNQGVSVVIIVSHLQNFSKEISVLIPALTGVDAVISGGGHELQRNASSTTIPTAAPVFGPALPSPAIAYPTLALDATAKQVPVYTAHFGNRYLGEFTIQLKGVTGEVVGFVDEAVRRVSGVTSTLTTSPAYGPDPDAVTGNALIQSQVIAPVQAYINSLNAQVFGATEVGLNGERGFAGTPRTFTPGVRNAETNLGNLVADSGRFASETDVYIQNGGGIRASIAGPVSPDTQRNISIGDSFTVLTFLNIVVADPSVSAAQLKAVLEHGFAASTTSGSVQGRFPQLSGVNVIYDTTRAVGDRVRKVVLTHDPTTSADDVVIIDYGRVLDSSIRFSVGTIDFLANGGDGYPFIANGFQFENLPFSRNYQEAFVDYIAFSTAQGGLGGLVTSQLYSTVNPFDRLGRIVDMIYATGGRDTIVGTAGNDLIFGGTGGDTITGGAGNDIFIYDSFRDAGDVITDFVPGSDRLDVSGLLASMGVPSNASALGTALTFTNVGSNCRINYVIPGQSPRPLVTVNGVDAAQLNQASNFVF